MIVMTLNHTIVPPKVGDWMHLKMESGIALWFEVISVNEDDPNHSCYVEIQAREVEIDVDGDLPF